MKEFASSEGRYLALLHRSLMKHLERELAPLNLGPGRYLYLFGLYVQDGRKQQDFADRLGLDKAAVTRSLARLEEDGYVTRRADRKDARVTRVFLTARGRRVQGTLEAAAQESVSALTAPLSCSERATLQGLLEKMAAPLTSD